MPLCFRMMRCHTTDKNDSYNNTMCHPVVMTIVQVLEEPFPNAVVRVSSNAGASFVDVGVYRARDKAAPPVSRECYAPTIAPPTRLQLMIYLQSTTKTYLFVK